MFMSQLVVEGGFLKLKQLAARETWQNALQKRQEEFAYAQERKATDLYARAKKVEKCQKVVAWITAQIEA